MLRTLVLALLFAATLAPAAQAQEQERRLTTGEIIDLLPRIVALGEGTRQTFTIDGDTNYVSRGQPSAGRWRVESDRYCSMWPPSGSWECYEVWIEDGAAAGLPARLIWIDEAGLRTENRAAPR